MAKKNGKSKIEGTRSEKTTAAGGDTKKESRRELISKQLQNYPFRVEPERFDVYLKSHFETQKAFANTAVLNQPDISNFKTGKLDADKTVDIAARLVVEVWGKIDPENDAFDWVAELRQFAIVNDGQLQEQVVEKICDLMKEQFGSSYSAEDYKNNLRKALVDELVGELRNIAATKYRKDIDIRQGFLKRAKHLLAGARQIITVSVDKISTFWIDNDPNSEGEVREYLQSQVATAEQIVRLFVFSSPDMVAKFSKTLNAHFEAYGRHRNCKGAVLLCGKQSYGSFLDLCFDDPSGYRNAFNDKDFALVQQASGNWLVVVHDSRSIQFENFETCDLNGLDIGLQRFYKSLTNPDFLTEQRAPSEDVITDQLGFLACMRWHSDLVTNLTNDDKRQKAMRNLFPSTLHGKALFCVFVKPTFVDREIRICNAIDSIKCELESKALRTRYGVTAFSCGKTLEKPLTFLIAIEFEDKQRCTAFRERRCDLEMRKEFYCACHPKVEELLRGGTALDSEQITPLLNQVLTREVFLSGFSSEEINLPVRFGKQRTDKAETSTPSANLAKNQAVRK